MKRILLILLMLAVASCSRRETPVPAQTPAPKLPPVTSTAPLTTAATETIVPRSSTGALDACSLISPAELKRITGSAFKGGINTTSESDVMRCTFPREDGGGISIMLHLKNVVADYRTMAGMTPVPGVPDDAWWSPQITTFVDRKGSHVLVVGFNFPDGDQKKWGEEIVREILPKL